MSLTITSGSVPGPDHEPFRALSRLPEASRRQARHADRDGSDPGLFSVLTDKYKNLAIEYYKSRQDYYAAVGITVGSVTTRSGRGTGASDAPFLTV